jgi:hypothetical protein
MRLALTLVVFGLDVWAIARILESRAPARSKLVWTVAVMALPLAGFIAWKMAGPKPPTAMVREDERGIDPGGRR